MTDKVRNKQTPAYVNINSLVVHHILLTDRDQSSNLNVCDKLVCVCVCHYTCDHVDKYDKYVTFPDELVSISHQEFTLFITSCEADLRRRNNI